MSHKAQPHREGILPISRATKASYMDHVVCLSYFTLPYKQPCMLQWANLRTAPYEYPVLSYKDS